MDNKEKTKKVGKIKTLKSKKIYVGNSGIHGKGLLAKKYIKKGEKVFIIKGRIVKFLVKNKKDSRIGPHWIGIGKNLWIDPVFEYGDYLNHSCDPTASIIGKVTVVALKDLKPGEEITIDYSISEIDELWHMRCNCGSKNCRKIIYSIQKLPDKVYKKYYPCIPRDFQKIYEKCKINNK